MDMLYDRSGFAVTISAGQDEFVIYLVKLHIGTLQLFLH